MALALLIAIRKLILCHHLLGDTFGKLKFENKRISVPSAILGNTDLETAFFAP